MPKSEPSCVEEQIASTYGGKGEHKSIQLEQKPPLFFGELECVPDMAFPSLDRLQLVLELGVYAVWAMTRFYVYHTGLMFDGYQAIWIMPDISIRLFSCSIYADHNWRILIVFDNHAIKLVSPEANPLDPVLRCISDQKSHRFETGLASSL
jgi:hypothetical protein